MPEFLVLLNAARSDKEIEWAIVNPKDYQDHFFKKHPEETYLDSFEPANDAKSLRVGYRGVFCNKVGPELFVYVHKGVGLGSLVTGQDMEDLEERLLTFGRNEPASELRDL